MKRQTKSIPQAYNFNKQHHEEGKIDDLTILMKRYNILSDGITSNSIENHRHPGNLNRG